MSSAVLGHDLSCVMDLDPLMIEVDGRRGLAESIARRLITPRGGLIDDPTYGYDLRYYLNNDISGTTARDLAMIAGNIEAECLKDERVSIAPPPRATVTFAAGTMTVAISIADAAGPFQLVLGVSSVTVAILKVSS